MTIRQATRSRAVATALAAAALLGGCAAPVEPTAPPTSSPASSASALATDATPGATPTPSQEPSALPSGSPGHVGGPLPTPGGRAGLDWTLVAPEVWSLFEPTRVAAGGAGVLVTGLERGREPQPADAWWHDGRGWLAVTPLRPDPAIVVPQLAIATDDGFAILGSFPQPDGPDRSVTWVASGAALGLDGSDSWTRADAPSGWGPLAAAPIGSGWVVLAATATGYGGPPDATWLTTDFTTWQGAPLSPGFPYAKILRVAPDRSLVVAGRLSTEAVDVTPGPVGELSLWRTTDGRSWTRTALTAAPFEDAAIEDLAARSGRWVAVGRRYPAGQDPDVPAPWASWWSNDGVTWQAGDGPTTMPWLDATFLIATPDRFVLVGTLGDASRVLAVSTDGKQWTSVDGPDLGGRIVAVAATRDGFVAAGSLSDAGGGGGALWLSALQDR